jgi:hypothetical protein
MKRFYLHRSVWPPSSPLPIGPFRLASRNGSRRLARSTRMRMCSRRTGSSTCCRSPHRKLPRLRPSRLPAHTAQEHLRSYLLRNVNQPVKVLNLWRPSISYALPARAGHGKEVRYTKVEDPEMHQRLLDLARQGNFLIATCKGAYLPLSAALNEKPPFTLKPQKLPLS